MLNEELSRVSLEFNSLIIFTNPVADPIKLVFFANEEFILFFADKLGHFIINDYFYM